MRLKPPSAGFALLALVYASCALFFAWGFAQPEQDRIWTLSQKIRSENLSEISSDDLDFFQRVTNKDEALVRWLLKGRPDGIISPNAKGWLKDTMALMARIRIDSKACAIELQFLGSQKNFPVSVRTQSLSWKTETTIQSPGQSILKIPPLVDDAEIFVLYVEAVSQHNSSSVNFKAKLVCPYPSPPKPTNRS